MTERVAIVGTRTFYPLDKVRDYVNSLPDGTVIVSGGARGVDRMAASAAELRGLKVIEWLADWKGLGKAAGPLRNTDIVNNCDRLVAFWNGISRGTNDSITKARAAGRPVTIIYADASN